ncbi:hypothetical protein N9S81_00260 [bacterium]|nr:hypothetical protein [bacterium]
MEEKCLNCDEEEQEQAVVVQDESLIAVLVVAVVSIFVAAVSFTNQCAIQLDCITKGSCRGHYDGSCSFSTAAAPVAYHMLNVTDLSVLTRGVCSPGERQTLDHIGRLSCVRALLYPDGTSMEVQDPGAYEYHDRACGKWINAREATDTAVMWGFFDELAVKKEVENAIYSDFETVLGTRSDFNRFRAGCEGEMENMAFSLAAENTYKYLGGHMKNTFTSLDDALHGIGKLTGHYCLAPASIGMAIDSNGDFRLDVSAAATAPNVDAILEALYAMGESASVRDRVREFAEAMDETMASLTPQATTPSIANTVAFGAISNTWLATSTAMTIGSLDAFTQLTGPTSTQRDTLGAFVFATGQTSFSHARSYLLGIAALCSFDVRASIDGTYGANLEIAKFADSRDPKRPNRLRRKAAALGRLHAVDTDAFVDQHSAKRLSKISRSNVQRATRVTFADLRALNYAGATGSPSSTCLETAIRVFVDDIDTYVLRKIAPSAPSDLATVVDTLKTAVAAEIMSGRTAALFTTDGVRSALSVDAANVRFKIAGAPRDGPFGREGSFTRPVLSSSDSSLTMLAKHAFYIFLDRAELALEQKDTCELPPLFEATSRNAYLLTAAPCAMLLPGILVQPFYDHRYSTGSLMSRIGYVVAHEVAHVGSDLAVWDPAVAELLFKNYTTSTWVEAAADLTAVDAVVSTGEVTADELCVSVSQLWCARVRGVQYGTSHPGPNLRGDNLCNWLSQS